MLAQEKVIKKGGVISRKLTNPPRSDIRIETVTFAPQNVHPGMRIVFATYVKAGNFPSKEVRCIGGIDSEVIMDVTIDFSQPYEKQKLTFLWDATPGTHEAWFECDPDHNLNDLDYSNNRGTIKVVEATTKPDLAVVSITTDKDVYAGDTAKLTVKFKYYGVSNVVIPRVVAALYHGGSSSPCETKVFTNITSGQTFEMYHTEYFGTVMTDSFRAKIDINNEVDEYDKQNNTLMKSINVYKK